MSTTNTFQGLPQENRNSSRVLKPPGGGSSNIFGDTAAAQPSKPRTQSKGIFDSPEPQPEPPARRDDTTKNLFGTGEAGNAAQQSKAEDADKEKENNSAQAPEQVEASAKPVAARYNPITGESVQQASTVSSTRVRQPPGGASTPLW